MQLKAKKLPWEAVTPFHQAAEGPVVTSWETSDYDMSEFSAWLMSGRRYAFSADSRMHDRALRWIPRVQRILQEQGWEMRCSDAFLPGKSETEPFGFRVTLTKGNLEMAHESNSAPWALLECAILTKRKARYYGLWPNNPRASKRHGWGRNIAAREWAMTQIHKDVERGILTMDSDFEAALSDRIKDFHQLPASRQATLNYLMNPNSGWTGELQLS